VTESQKASVAGVISLSGYSLLAAVLILTVMIAPLMVSIFSDGLRAVRPGWLEGSLALGVNRWRTTWKIGVRTARPAIVAGTVLAVARAIGEAVMLAMVSGSVAFSPNPADGLIFVYEPSRPLAPTIVKNVESLGSPPANSTLFAIAAVLLFSAALFSLAGWTARRAMRRYGATA
jgi:ABC-type phosphate transport system permease subunit